MERPGVVRMIKKLHFRTRNIDQKIGFEDAGGRISHIRGLIMIYLSDHEDGTVIQKDLEKALNLQRSSISEMLDTLEEKGLVRRIPSEQDRRQKCVVLTEEGKKEHEAVLRRIRKIEEASVRGFTPEEAAQLRSMLGRVEHNLKEFEEELEGMQE